MTVVWRSVMMRGMAMLTMVTSSNAMNMPIETAIRIHHLRGWPWSGAWAGSFTSCSLDVAGSAPREYRGPAKGTLRMVVCAGGLWVWNHERDNSTSVEFSVKMTREAACRTIRAPHFRRRRHEGIEPL